MSRRYHNAFWKYRLLAGLTAIIDGPAEAQRRFALTKDQVRYWQNVILHKRWHPHRQGGPRNFTYTPGQRRALHTLIYKKLIDNPQVTFEEIITYVNTVGFIIDKSYISRLLRRWRWTRKVPAEQQIQKYSVPNLKYYAHYLLAVHDIPWHKLKFLDESHFRSSELHRKTVFAPKGQRAVATHYNELDLGYSLTLMTSLSNKDEPVLIDLRFKSNSQWDFARFLLDAIATGFLQSGDVLVVDNARIHFGEQTAPMISRLTKTLNIRILHLPTYSCELNPCELVFNYIKGLIRRNREYSRPFWMEIMIALAEVNILHLYTWYEKCLTMLSQEK